MKVNKTTIIILLLILCALLALTQNDIRRVYFIYHWKNMFASVATGENLTPWSKNDRPDLIFKRVYDDGTWVMALSESESAGDSFNASVFLDSSGFIVWTDYLFSGYEGLSEEVSRVPSSTISDFHVNAKQFKLRKSFGIFN